MSVDSSALNRFIMFLRFVFLFLICHLKPVQK